MTGKLKYYLKNNTDITDKQIDQISGCFRTKTVKNNTLLLSEGETCKELYFVHSGCIISQKSSSEFVETLENSELYAISNKDFYQLVSDIPLWENFYRKFLEMAYLHQNKKIENRITLSAKQRYDRLMREEPMYIQRLSNKILASYLDITQETLSRLKSR
ncbi:MULTISPECIES: Crp/Fnr family transcriptional regulator [Sphingobacterium]|uniref:Crp/Fnr family transcriptional regulator n=1 Tax=Sphingobacterium ginsenosidimutans TaxID=687845 RepID=A0ABP8ABK1_9SPHI|nr:hypothetical protein [Sphingobacterium sp. E70]ULT26008.1 hypothetical protein KUH03_03285 [Sphingobacterium sp. E70]